MRPILFAAAVIGAESVLASTGAMAKYYPWCSFYTREAAENCSFITYEQCSKNISGVGGWCSRNPDAAAAPVYGPKSVYVRPVRKKADVTKQASSKDRFIARPAATTGISTSPPGSRTPIPLPDQALLTPPTGFDCELKTATLDDASGQPQPRPTPTEADRGTDAALRMKLDYERQCYQHAEMILRDRMRRLQAAVGETIKAADRSERPAASTGFSARPGARTVIPRPDQALMTPPEFNCEFRTTSLDEASGQPQPRPPPAEADRGTEAALRMKLDYERQCYHHGEMILRDRLRRLQAAVGETIKAAKR
jgi:Protein of unknown function (DUF3551)